MQTSVRKITAVKSTPESLFAANQKLIGAVLSKRFSGLPTSLLEEAEQQGRLGLWHAAKNFDPTLGFAFSTYATNCIRGYIQHLLRRETRLNKIPCVSLDAPLVSGKERSTLADLLPDPESAVEAALDRAGESARLAALIRSLPLRQRELLTALYLHERTLQEVADDWDMTRQRASQLHVRAIRRLRQSLEQTMLEQSPSI